MGRVTWAELADVYTSDCGDKILGQAKGSLRIAGQFVVTPSGGVGAGFVQEGRREGVVPDDRERFVDLRVIEEVIAQSAVVVRCCGWDPVNCKGGVIFAGYVGIETPVVLLEISY